MIGAEDEQRDGSIRPRPKGKGASRGALAQECRRWRQFEGEPPALYDLGSMVARLSGGGHGHSAANAVRPSIMGGERQVNTAKGGQLSPEIPRAALQIE